MTVGPVAADTETAPFLAGTAQGVLLLRRCPDQHWSEPAAMACADCGSSALTWEAAEGGGELVSWAVTHPRSGAGAPVVLAVVQLDEGPWWWTQLVDVAPDAVAMGMRLRVDFVRAPDSEAVPVLRAG